MRVAVGVTAVVGLLGLAVCVVHATVGFGSPAPGSWFTTYVYPLLFLAPAALFFLKAGVDGRERRVWTAIGVGYVLWVAAYLFYSVSVANGITLGTPSPADAGWLAIYPLVFVGFVRLLRSRNVVVRKTAWLDGVIGALALGAVASAFLVDPIVSAVSGAPSEVATLLAYPLGDAALALVGVSIGTALGWRPGRDWMMIGAALTMQVGADVIYSYKSATGSWHFGTLVDSVWLASALLIAWAAWHKPAVNHQCLRSAGTGCSSGRCSRRSR